MKRTFLFLQGPCTPFFSQLAQRLAGDHAVQRIHFCMGDALYWRSRPARRYVADADGLRDHLDHLYRHHGITDQILFGDRRPVHRPAVDHGEACGVRTHVFEEGYFRPFWVTLEREGVNGHSLLPRDPDWFRDAGGRLAEPDAPVHFRTPFSLRAAHDVAYHAAGALNPVFFPGYRSHAPVVAPLEYAGYARRFVYLRFIRERERRRVADLLAAGRPYYFLPLQLNSDAQIRDHSRFAHMGEVIEHVMASFARHAPSGALLVIKNHPLDAGLMDLAGQVRRYGRHYQVEDRTVYLEDGDLHALVDRAQGVVTVNSTVGLVALEAGRPTLSLSDPIYNLPGLTFQGGLDEFWRGSEGPDRELFAGFRRVVMHATQVNGGFYCPKGIALAVDNSARVLTAARSPLEALL
jgi:capsular polysaccharide export protein